jgi:DNA-binding MarR family transcriptional regulator
MEEKAFDYHQIDELLHSRIRIAVVSVLARCHEAEFTYIRDAIGTTDGNLNTHCQKLEAAGYITIDKRFVGKKPATFFSLTGKGRKALVAYTHNLVSLIQDEDVIQKEEKR